MSDQLRDQLVALNPAPTGEVPPALRAAVLANVRAEAATSARPRRRGRRRRLFPLGLFAALAISTGALATAVAIHSGKPLPRLGIGSPLTSAGKPLRGTVHLLSLRVADPAGGPPWGIRTYRTGRGAECWQFGRVLNGQLGRLGVDGSMHDDGLFHALPVVAVDCRPLDGAGHLYALQDSLTLESAVPDHTCYAGSRMPLPGCDPRHQLDVTYGFLGPLARSVTVDGRRTIRIAPGDEGAFMSIQSHIDVLQRQMHLDTFTATYADGSTRPVDDVLPMESVTNDPPRGTTPPGYVPPERALPPASSLRSPVHVIAPAHMGRNVIYRVQYRVPVTATRYGVQYLLTLSGGAQGPSCANPAHFGGYASDGNAIPRDGRTMTVSISPASVGRWNRGWCPGTYRGAVMLHDRAHSVGTFRFTVPR